jgi:hypothetical protein
MGIFITDRMIALNEAGDAVSLPSHPHWMPHQLVVIPVHILTMFVLNDHVMHDHTSHHDVPKDLLIPEVRWTSNNRKLGLQNPKFFLNILPSSRLSTVKVLFFLPEGLPRGFTNVSHFG